MTQPYSIVSISSALRHPDFELEGSARSVVQFEGILPEAAPCVAYAPIDLDGQVVIVFDVPPRYMNSFVWLYTWPAASTLNVAVDSGIPLVRKHMISVLASDTVRPNAAHLYAQNDYLCWSGKDQEKMRKVHKAQRIKMYVHTRERREEWKRPRKDEESPQSPEDKNVCTYKREARLGQLLSHTEA